MKTEEYLRTRAEKVHQCLEALLPAQSHYPQSISQSVRYSVFAGGKRVRPVLSLAVAEALELDEEAILPFASALELIHTYTLIHDDLPAIDNDSLRRGKPTNHTVYGEAIAILAGDALQSIAFQVFATKHHKNISAENQLNALKELATTIGIDGTIGGQVVDIESEKAENPSVATLEYIHTHKTGALLLFAVRLPALLYGIQGEKLSALTAYGKATGLAFQIVDDILDITGTSASLGKTAGKDESSCKLTYPALHGLEESKEMADTLLQQSLDALVLFGDKADRLREIARYLIDRHS